MKRFSQQSAGRAAPEGWWLDRDLVHAITSPPPHLPNERSACDVRLQCDVAELEIVSMAQLAQLSQVSPSDLRDLMDYGLLTPIDSSQESLLFAAEQVPVLCRARRLREDLALDSHGFALALMLLLELERIRPAFSLLLDSGQRAFEPGPGTQAPFRSLDRS